MILAECFQLGARSIKRALKQRVILGVCVPAPSFKSVFEALRQQDLEILVKLYTLIIKLPIKRPLQLLKPDIYR